MSNKMIVFSFIALLLAGCAVGPDYIDPIMETPSSYRTQVMPVDTASDLKWWTLFEDPLLYDLVTTALENNRDMKIAVSRIEEEEASPRRQPLDRAASIDSRTPGMG